jgi:hypothetical protein
MQVNRIIELSFFPHGRAFEILVLAVDHHSDAAVLRDHGFKRDPPQLTEPVWKAGSDIHGEWQLVFPE